MRVETPFVQFSASRAVASIFGILAGLGGFIHGIGESLQGSVAPGAIVFDSWTQGPIAAHMDGEPAMSLVPNLLATGILTILVSLAVLIWSAVFVQREHGGKVLILLSIAMLLVGGGFGPPLMGILAGVAGTRHNASVPGWTRRLPPAGRRFLVKAWPWVFATAVTCGVILVVGSFILVYTVGLHNADLFLNIFYLTALSLIATVLLAPLYEAQRSRQGRLV